MIANPRPSTHYLQLKQTSHLYLGNSLISRISPITNTIDNLKKRADMLPTSTQSQDFAYINTGHNNPISKAVDNNYLNSTGHTIT